MLYMMRRGQSKRTCGVAVAALLALCAHTCYGAAPPAVALHQRQVHIRSDASLAPEDISLLQDVQDQDVRSTMRRETRSSSPAGAPAEEDESEVSADPPALDAGSGDHLDEDETDGETCVDGEFVDSMGFTCDGYGSSLCDGKSNLTEVEAGALTACCACGGGSMNAKGVPLPTKATTRTAAGGECQWTEVHGQSLWTCAKGTFVTCVTDDDCNQPHTQEALGGSGFECHGPPVTEKGFCVPPVSTSKMEAEITSVSPAVDDSSFLQLLPDGEVKVLSPDPTDHHLLQSTGHPCCCHPEPDRAHALLQTEVSRSELSVDATALMQTSGVEDTERMAARTDALVNMESQVATELTRRLALATGKTEEEGKGASHLAGASERKVAGGVCSRVDCTNVYCSTAPPAVVVKFRVQSSNGVPLIGASLDQNLEGKESCSESATCVGVREAGQHWDKEENAARMIVSMPAHKSDMSLELADAPSQPTGLVLGAPPTMPSDAGGATEVVPPGTLKTATQTLFLVDISASSARHVKEIIAQQLGTMYRTLCAPTKDVEAEKVESAKLAKAQAKTRWPASSVDVHASVSIAGAGHPSMMQLVGEGGELPSWNHGNETALTSFCGVYAFDGSQFLQAVVPFSSAKTLPSSVELGAMLESLTAKDRTTNLYGALAAARKELEGQPMAAKSTFTLVLVTDGEERAHRMPKEVASKAVAALNAETYVLFIDHGAEESRVAERFLCHSILHSHDRCCTGVAQSASHGKQCATLHVASSAEDELDEEALELTRRADLVHRVGEDARAKRQAAQLAGSKVTEEEEEIDGNITASAANTTGVAATHAHGVGAEALNHFVDAIAGRHSAQLEALHAAQEEAEEAAETWRRKYVVELQQYKIKRWKYENAKRKAVARERLAQARHTKLAQSLAKSWSATMKVYDELLLHSQYAIAMCSSYRAASESGHDQRVGRLLLASGGANVTVPFHGQSGFHFSSRSFRESQCTQKTLRAALGLAKDLDAAEAETQRLGIPFGGMMAASGSSMGASAGSNSEKASESVKKEAKGSAGRLGTSGLIAMASCLMVLHYGHASA